MSFLIFFWWIKSNQYGKSKWIKMNHCDSFASKVNQNESESKIKWFAEVNQKSKKDFDSPRESKSFCDFWFTLANQKFANQNESIRFESWLSLIIQEYISTLLKKAFPWPEFLTLTLIWDWISKMLKEFYFS